MRLYWVIFHHCDQITGIELALWILKKSVARIGSLTKDLLKSREERNYRRISGKNSSFWAASQGRKGEFSWRGGGGGDRDSPRDRPTWKTSFTPPAELHNCVFQTHHQWKSSLNFLMHYGTRKKTRLVSFFFLKRTKLVIQKLSLRETGREKKKNGKKQEIFLRTIQSLWVVGEANNTLFSGCPPSSRPP